MEKIKHMKLQLKVKKSEALACEWTIPDKYA